MRFGGYQSVLNPYGPEAADLHLLSWVVLIGFTAVWVIVMAWLLYALYRGRRGHHPGERASTGLVAWPTAATTVILLAFLVWSVALGRGLDPRTYRGRALTIDVTGKQWWWEVRYMRGSDNIAVTANEIHIPTGTPVLFKLRSTDVIHSFWVPNLGPKMDLIPGRTNELWLQADRAGVYRGQCAEYCGLQHAHMALEVVADEPGTYRRWLEAQRSVAPEPQTPAQQRGREVFVRGPCALCHNVRGTPASGSVGPDLTHIASRRTIAAATLMNNRGNLGGWVVNAQGVKPGNQMPRINLRPEDLEDLLAYLETLK